MELLQQNSLLQHHELAKKRLTLSLKDFKITKIINLGNQSNFYEAQSLHFDEKIVIKSIEKPQMQSQSKLFLQKVKNEILLNTKIGESQKTCTKYFTQFHGYFIENNKVILIFELGKLNALQMMKKLKTYDQKYTFCLILLHDMINVIDYLEKLQISHNDLKPENILFKENFFKLHDFSYAKKRQCRENHIIEIGKDDIKNLAKTIFYLLQGRTKSSFYQEVKQNQSQENECKMNMNQQQRHFIINKKNQKQKYIQVFPLNDMLNKILNSQVVKTKTIASQIHTEYFKTSQLDQQNYQKLIQSLIYCSKSQNKQNQAQLLKHLFLKVLQHRGQQLSVYFLIFLSSIKQMIKINKKLTKLNRVMQNVGITKNKKVLLQIKLLNNVKTSCIKMVQVLYKIMAQKSFQSMQSANAITSFGQIQLNIQNDKKIDVHQDHNKLQDLVKILLDTYSQYEKQNEEQQNHSMAKILQQQICKKSVKFDNVLVCISQNTSKNQIQMVNFNQKSFSKIKSQKKVQSLQKTINNKLPKSIKYINDQNSCKEVNQKQVLDNFLKFYSKDNLKQKFPLLGEITFILKRLVQTADDPLKRQIFVQQEFKIWNLSLVLFKI